MHGRSIVFCFGGLIWQFCPTAPKIPNSPRPTRLTSPNLNRKLKIPNSPTALRYHGRGSPPLSSPLRGRTTPPLPPGPLSPPVSCRAAPPSKNNGSVAPSGPLSPPLSYRPAVHQRSPTVPAAIPTQWSNLLQLLLYCIYFPPI